MSIGETPRGKFSAIREVAVASFEQFHEIIRENQSEWWNWYYRGNPRSTDRLIPRVGREPWRTRVGDDRGMFEGWRRHAIAFVDRPELTDWDWLAIAQHHGLATRLLDWTFNALTAAYFAVGYDLQDVEGDAAVFAHYSSRKVIDQRASKSPFSVPGINRLRPSSVTPRILKQGGIFTLHNPAHVDLEEALPKGDRLIKITINAEYRHTFASELSHYGANSLSMFPDLDGLSRHMNWSFLRLNYSNS
jgi:hypothetical protein